MAAACAVAMASPAIAQEAPASAPPTVAVAQGTLAGARQGGVDAYLGIPYAKPPIGELRWRPPVEAQPWTGVRPALRFGARCPQLDGTRPLLHTDEDCLTLNVFAPAAPSASARPVLVWVHGGGFRTGSGQNYNGAFLANKLDAIVVTMNYRLGVFGFLSTSGMATEGQALNFGMQDQQAALRWVQANAHAFGGDPARVTLAGQSAGGVATGCLALTVPGAKGLFSGVIAMSSYCANVADPLPKATAFGDKLALDGYGCAPGPGQMACLRALPTDRIMAASKLMPQPSATSTGEWHVAIDGHTVPEAPLTAMAKGRVHKVPVMIGATQDEGRFFVGMGHATLQRGLTQAEYNMALEALVGKGPASIALAAYPSSKYGSPDLALSAMMTDSLFACPTYSAARYLSGHVPTFVYELADRRMPAFDDPFMPWGAYHAGDLGYIFRTAQFEALLDAGQLALSDQWLGYWKRFVYTAQPNGKVPGEASHAAPHWPRFNRLFNPVQTLEPGKTRTSALGAFSRSHQCLLWSTLIELQVLADRF